MPVPRSVPRQSLSSTTLVKKGDRKLGMESTVKGSIRQKADRALGTVTPGHVAQGQGSPAAARVPDRAASCAPQSPARAARQTADQQHCSSSPSLRAGTSDRMIKHCAEGKVLMASLFVCLASHFWPEESRRSAFDRGEGFGGEVGRHYCIN